MNTDKDMHPHANECRSKEQLATGRPLFMTTEEKDDHLNDPFRTPRTFSKQRNHTRDEPTLRKQRPLD
ncbi:hypothetical protein Trydic_g2378 [Trypoxylus dichotomus]